MMLVSRLLCFFLEKRREEKRREGILDNTRAGNLLASQYFRCEVKRKIILITEGPLLQFTLDLPIVFPAKSYKILKNRWMQQKSYDECFPCDKIICDRSIDFTIELSQIWGQKRVKREEENTALLIVQEK